MAKRHYHLDTHILTVFFFVAMPFVAFGSFIVVSMARGSLQDSVGEGFELRARQTKLDLERYVEDQIVHLHLLSLDSEVRAALQAPRRPLTEEDARNVEQAWATGRDAPALSSILASPLAGRLREIARVRPALKLLQVIGADAALVATSGRGGRLVHDETPWFRALSQDSAHGPFVGGVQRSGSSGPVVLEIAHPVSSPRDGAWLGAVRALVDVGDLYSVLATVRIGRTGHAVLVRASDGIVLASDKGVTLKDVFPGFESIQAAMREHRGYWIIGEIQAKSPAGATARVEPARLAGYSPVDQVPGVDWMVIVEQDLGEATAPVQGVTRYLWIHFIGAFGSVILLALYLSFKQETPIIEEELHLHEEHVPPSMDRESHGREAANGPMTK